MKPVIKNGLSFLIGALTGVVGIILCLKIILALQWWRFVGQDWGQINILFSLHISIIVFIVLALIVKKRSQYFGVGLLLGAAVVFMSLYPNYTMSGRLRNPGVYLPAIESPDTSNAEGSLKAYAVPAP